ncbi:hypothetical protein [Edaphovirga cremea]|uniref:hypothetical protein n=1 Tax=Edaphovirga cremea TaxID=2267246 RepID=UPI0039892986
MERKYVIVLPLIFLMVGCATKQYPQTPMISTEEARLLDCKQIQQEIVKTKSIEMEIERTGDFDGKTVLGVLGDLGIGKGDARKKVAARLTQLDAIKTAKQCPVF